MPRHRNNRNKKRSSDVGSEAGASPAPEVPEPSPTSAPAPEGPEHPTTPAQSQSAKVSASPPAASSSAYRLSGDRLSQAPVDMAADQEARLAQVKAAKEQVEAHYHDLLAAKDAEIDEMKTVIAGVQKSMKELREDSASARLTDQKERTNLRAEWQRLEQENRRLNALVESDKMTETRLRGQLDAAQKDLVRERTRAGHAERQVEEMTRQTIEQNEAVGHLHNTIAQLETENEEASKLAEGDETATENAAAKEELEAARKEFAGIFPEAPSDLTMYNWVQYIRECKDIPDQVKTVMERHPLLQDVQKMQKSIQDELDDTGYGAPPEGELKQAHDRIAMLEQNYLEVAEQLRESRNYLRFSEITSVETAPEPIPEPTEASLSQNSDSKESGKELSPASTTSIEAAPGHSPLKPGEASTTNVIYTFSDYQRIFHSSPLWFQLLVLASISFFILLCSGLWSEWSFWTMANDVSRQRVVYFTSPGQYEWYPSPIIYDLGKWLGVDFTPLG